jgi:hopanoid biosynthesis associated radical SAM protein HpnJ
MVPNSKLIDAPADNLSVEDVLKEIPQFDMVVLHTSTPTFPGDAQMARRIRQLKPSLTIGMVGSHVSVLPRESLESCEELDFVVRKEFDYACQAIAQGADYKDVRGLHYRSPSGEIKQTADSQVLSNLDLLPHVVDVYKRDLTIENYYIGYLLHPYVSLYTGRGCPARCTFCLWPQTIGGQSYRTRSPESVLEEMTKAKEFFPQAKEFFFDDDTFTANVTRAKKIATGLKKLGLTWACTSRANVPYDHLKFLRECGLRLFLVGYESGNEDMLKRIEKGVTLATARRFTRDCKRLGIKIHGTFIMGLPQETRESIEQTIRFACDIDPDTIQVSLAAAYPGTKMYDQAMQNRWFVPHTLVNKNGYQDAVLQYEGASAKDISEGVDRMYRQFYFRFRKISSILRGMVTDAHEMSRRLREGMEFLGYLLARRKMARDAQA